MCTLSQLLKFVAGGKSDVKKETSNNVFKNKVSFWIDLVDSKIIYSEK